jgi:hypothetical protein
LRLELFAQEALRLQEIVARVAFAQAAQHAVAQILVELDSLARARIEPGTEAA